MSAEDLQSAPDPEPGGGTEEMALGTGSVGPAGRGEPGKRSGRSLMRELPVLVIVALVIAMIIKTFVVQAFVIPTGSMQNTLAKNDKILVNKLVYHFRAIQPGDIVVFDGTGTWNPRAPQASASSNPLARAYDDTIRRALDSIGGLFGTPIGQTDYVKRVIGVPGDHVICCNAQGHITVNGVAVDEQSYLYPGNSSSSPAPGISGMFNVVVPSGYIWVLGDHRSVSDDSRGHVAYPGNGMIPEDKVIGRAFLIAWPPSQWGILPIPATFQQPGISSPVGSAGGRQPGSGYLPLASGFAAAMPLTLIQRVVRRRFRRIRRRNPGWSGGASPAEILGEMEDDILPAVGYQPSQAGPTLAASKRPRR